MNTNEEYTVTEKRKLRVVVEKIDSEVATCRVYLAGAMYLIIHLPVAQINCIANVEEFKAVLVRLLTVAVSDVLAVTMETEAKDFIEELGRQLAETQSRQLAEQSDTKQ